LTSVSHCAPLYGEIGSFNLEQE